MKSRIRRFWFSVSLAASSLAFPLSSSLWSHDLPIRWASGANPPPSWNLLLDECLDKSQTAGSRTLMDSDATLRRGTEDWASSCPAEWTQAQSSRASSTLPPLDTDMLARNPLSRFSKEMTCWVNEWQDFQYSSQASRTSTPELSFAAFPDEGQPPAPGLGEIASISGPEDYSSDTCAFDAEYQARQAAADLLAAEMARASQIAATEARVQQALADAESLERIASQDALPSAIASGKLVTTGSWSHSSAEDMALTSRCGGYSNEAISQNCFPNRFAQAADLASQSSNSSKTSQPSELDGPSASLRAFAPGLVDEYMAYDLNENDSHWLGGLGKSWKLRSALATSRSGSPSMPSMASRPAIAREAMAADYVAPESFVAPDNTDSGLADDQSALANSDTEQFNNYLDHLMLQAQQSTLAILDNARRASQPVGQALEEAPKALPHLLPSLHEQIVLGCDWIENQQCLISAELCGFEHAFQLGHMIGSGSLQSAQIGLRSYVAMGAYIEPRPELVVVYEDSEGEQLVVPSSIARAWNRPQTDLTGSESVDLAIDVHQLRDQVITYIAEQLDSLGMACLQTSDQLLNWSKVARAKSVDVR